MKKNKVNKANKRSIFWFANVVLVMLFTGSVIVFEQIARTASPEAETAAVHVTLSGSVEPNFLIFSALHTMRKPRKIKKIKANRRERVESAQ